MNKEIPIDKVIKEVITILLSISLAIFPPLILSLFFYYSTPLAISLIIDTVFIIFFYFVRRVYTARAILLRGNVTDFSEPQLAVESHDSVLWKIAPIFVLSIIMFYIFAFSIFDPVGGQISTGEKLTRLLIVGSIGVFLVYRIVKK